MSAPDDAPVRLRWPMCRSAAVTGTSGALKPTLDSELASESRRSNVGSGLGASRSWAARRGAAAGMVWRCRILLDERRGLTRSKTGEGAGRHWVCHGAYPGRVLPAALGVAVLGGSISCLVTLMVLGSCRVIYLT
jgi:hypothetical protein